MFSGWHSQPKNNHVAIKCGKPANTAFIEMRCDGKVAKMFMNETKQRVKCEDESNVEFSSVISWIRHTEFIHKNCLEPWNRIHTARLKAHQRFSMRLRSGDYAGLTLVVAVTLTALWDRALVSIETKAVPITDANKFRECSRTSSPYRNVTKNSV